MSVAGPQSGVVSTAELLGRTLVRAGVRQVFGVVGSGNFRLTNAMIAAGATFVAARHEGGAATMADAYARSSEEVTALSVHQGCGYTNTITGIAEAAKSRTPLVVLAPQATTMSSNFYIDQAAIATAVGAVPWPIVDPATAVIEIAGAVGYARAQRRTVVINLSLDVLEAPNPQAGADLSSAGASGAARTPIEATALGPTDAHLAELLDLLRSAERPVFVAGRGARQAKEALSALANVSGALLATSAVAAGLFADEKWNIGISGGFSSPATAELIGGADLIIGWGCALNMWTMRHGALIGPAARVVQVDDTPAALGAHRRIHLGVIGDVAATATEVAEVFGEPRRGYRTDAAAVLMSQVRWADVPFVDASTETRIDPRTLTLALNEILPPDRVVGVDSGNFMGYPSMFFDHADERGLCFTQAFQSIGLGLATAIGAGLAEPDRLPVAALGDGGALMGVAELEVVARLGMPMVVIVYNDDAYGAEVHHFAGENHSTVTFPPVDIAAVARGFGFTAATVRTSADLDAVRDWVSGPRQTPLLIDAKIVADEPAWWLAEAFGH